MTPARFRAILNAIGWTQRGLADRVGVHETRVRRWASGEYPVPEKLVDWMEQAVEWHAKHAPPKIEVKHEL